MRIHKALFLCPCGTVKTVLMGFFNWGDYLDDEIRKAVLREQIKKKNGGKNEVAAKYHTKYPASTEREYIRVAYAYMALEKQSLQRNIPELKRILQAGSELHTDSAADNDKKRKKARVSLLSQMVADVQSLFQKIKGEIDFLASVYRLPERLNKIANQGHKFSVGEWKKMVRKTFGIDILEDYYSGDQYKVLLKEWISQNVDLIQTVPYESLEKMKEIIFSNYVEGKTTTDIVRKIQQQYAMDKNRAKLIAKDQTSKLNAAITQYQQREAGVHRYQWSDSGDSRTRECHASLNGKVFSWDKPPEMWYRTKNGIVRTGRHCHPGEDYQCRCCALPVFDIDQLDLPV